MKMAPHRDSALPLRARRLSVAGQVVAPAERYESA